jgi:hypothetical protein
MTHKDTSSGFKNGKGTFGIYVRIAENWDRVLIQRITFKESSIQCLLSIP